MNKLEAKNLIVNTFEKPFDEAQFTYFIKNLLNNLDETKASGWQQGQYIFSEFRDVVKRFRRIGQYIDSNHNEIDILLVNLYDEKALFKARTKQRDFVAKYLKNKIRPAALAAYYNEESDTWRFSFVRLDYTLQKQTSGKVKVIPELSSARRYSFLVGKNEINLTAQNQLVSLFEKENERITLDDIVNTFSIEKVTQEFYSELKTILKSINANYISRISESKKIDFSQLLINRLLFLKFLEKKGWLFVTPEDSEAERKNYLNRMKEKFAGRNLWSDFFYHLFFRGLNLHSYGNPQIQSSIHNIIGYVPFLNGGLFQEANELEEGWNDSQVSVDNTAFDLIFDKLLNRFNFTIDENLADEIEISLNPDLLGYTYEEFIADSHGQGAYYTHPVEVGLMCRESLKTFLEERTDFSPVSISNLVDNYSADDFSDEDALHIYKILVKIKILDPAIGSGVYPVRMMQELVSIHQALAKKITSGSLGQIASNRLIDPNNRYSFKLNIVQNNIYGTDIDHYAVEIAKLRFWLSLVVDYQTEINSSDDLQNVPALPNLDFKLRTGDSLMSVVKKSSSTNSKSGYNLDLMFRHHQIDAFFEGPIRELSGMKSKFFQFEELKKKKEIPEQMTKQQLKENIQTLEKNLAREIGITEIETFKKVNHILWQIHFAEIFDEHLQFGFDICIANPPYLRQEKINELFSSFESGITKDELVSTYESLFAEKKIKIDKKSDLYVYFFLRGVNLLSEKGVLCFICSNSWLDVGYGKSLQETLLKTTRIKAIIDNSAKRSFEKADVNTTINIFVKDSSVDKEEGNPNTGKKKSLSTEKLVRFIVFKDKFEKAAAPNEINLINTTTNITSNEKWRVYPISQIDLYKSGLDEDLNYEGDKWGGKYLRAPDIFFTILEKGKNKLVRLGDIAEIRRGFTTGANEFFYLDENKIAEWRIEKEFLKPVLKSPRECKNLLVDKSELKYNIFICNQERTKLKGTNALKYIEWGEEKGFHNNETVLNRKQWYSIPKDTFGNAFWVKETNDRLGVFIAEKKILADCRLYYASVDLNMQNIVNSTLVNFFTEALSRAGLGEGARSMMVFEVNNILVPDPNLFNFTVFKIRDRILYDIFTECGFDKTKPIRSQKPNPLPDRKTLDDIIFDALGLTQAERTEVYYAVCELVQNRLNKAKSV